MNDDLVSNFDIGRSKFELNLSHFNIPQEYDGIKFYSSTAKKIKKEITEYLKNSSENEKLFYSIREKIYNDDTFTPESLIEFSIKNSFDCKYLIRFI
jgi:phosphomannomutase